MLSRPSDVTPEDREAFEAHALTLEERLLDRVEALLDELDSHAPGQLVYRLAFKPNETLPRRTLRPKLDTALLAEQVYRQHDPSEERLDAVLEHADDERNHYPPVGRTGGMFRSGRFVADALGDVDADQVQPNGVDLRLDAVYEQTRPGRIGTDGKVVGERREIPPEKADAGGRVYRLDPGGYVVQYADTVRIPDGHVGFLYPRSSLLRNSCMLNTAVWDAGYEGRGEGLLEVYHEVELEPGARIAQLVLAEASHEERYGGDYQRERLD